MKNVLVICALLSFLQVGAYSSTQVNFPKKASIELVRKSGDSSDKKRGKDCCKVGKQGKEGPRGRRGQVPYQSGTMTVTFSNFGGIDPSTIFRFLVVDPLGNKYFSTPLDIASLPPSASIVIGPRLYSGTYVIYAQYLSGNPGVTLLFNYEAVNSNNTDRFAGQGLFDVTTASSIGSGTNPYFVGAVSSYP